METTRLWLEESNITDDPIVFVQQNPSKIGRKKVLEDPQMPICTTKTQLIDRIKAVFYILPRGTVTSAFSRFRSRIESVIDVE